MSAADLLPLVCVHGWSLNGRVFDALRAALPAGYPLQTLDLRSNQVGDVGAAGLGEGLKSNAALQTLYLDSNQVGASQAAAFLATHGRRLHL